MIGGRASNWVVGLCFVIFFAISGLMWFTHYYDFSDICPADEAGQLARCAREWLSIVVSGAAMVFAAGTIIVLYRQNEEQKKQTGFLLGNASPTVDAIAHIKDPQKCVIRIVNWNRRPIIVRTLKVLGSSFRLSIDRTRIWDRDDPDSRLSGRDMLGEEIFPAIALHGWKNRSQAPGEVRIDIRAIDDKGEHADDWSETFVEVGIVMAGEDSDTTTLKCRVAVAET